MKLRGNFQVVEQKAYFQYVEQFGNLFELRPMVADELEERRKLFGRRGCKKEKL